MGDKNDPMAVVTSDCKVIGVNNLRVADASIFPRITNGNLNGPCMMVGEKAADHILGKPLLPKSNQIPYNNTYEIYNIFRDNNTSEHSQKQKKYH
jgi:choline dehydrogenase